jgi:hypothetical protein
MDVLRVPALKLDFPIEIESSESVGTLKDFIKATDFVPAGRPLRTLRPGAAHNFAVQVGVRIMNQ